MADNKRLSKNKFIREKQTKAYVNDMKILFALAKFGWLTWQQVNTLFFPSHKLSSAKARLILNRLSKERLVKKQNLNASDTDQIKAYHLTAKGMKELLSHNFSQKLMCKKTKRTITDCRYQYHRFLANQVLIDMRNNSLKSLSTLSNNKPAIFSEHDMKTIRDQLNSDLGCIPDGIFITQNKRRTMWIVEIENSRRGTARHATDFNHASNKLVHWLPAYFARIYSEREFGGSLLYKHDYDDVKELFVCADEKIFRSIWRHVSQLMEDYNYPDEFKNRIYYILLNEKKWVSPLSKENTVVFEHFDKKIPQILADADPHARSHRIK